MFKNSRRWTWILAAALVVGAVAAVTLFSADDPEKLADAPAAKSASEFVDSVGVNVHLNYYDTSYAEYEKWSKLLEELGIRHIRDGLVLGDEVYVERLRRLGSAGVRASLIVSEDRGPADASVALAAGALRGTVATLEGPNEPDLNDPDGWESSMRRFVPELRRAVDERLGDRVPLLAPSFVDPEARGKVADLDEMWDVENIHPYPGGYEPTPPESATGDGPVMATETGYHNALEAPGKQQPAVPEEIAGDYVPRLYAEYFAGGIERSFLYELIDEKPETALRDAEQHFGLLRQDLSRKPAFDAVAKLMRTVANSPGEGPSRDVKTEGGGSDLQRLLLEREDGSRVLLLWRRAPLWDPERRKEIEQEAAVVGLRFSGEARDIAVNYPSRDGEPDQRPSASRTDVVVGGDLVVVSYR